VVVRQRPDGGLRRPSGGPSMAWRWFNAGLAIAQW
jgi:hypothetical protein